MIYSGPGFLAILLFGSYLTPSPRFPSISSTGDTQEGFEREQLADGRGGGGGGWGEEPNQMTAREPGPL
jgi:hypothetical protein